MPDLAIDVSNYTSGFTLENLNGLKAEGLKLVIVQAVDPPPNYPAGVTRSQVAATLAAGLPVDAYVYLWFSLGAEALERHLSLLDGFPIRQLWLDVEDTGAKYFSPLECETTVQAALNVCDAYKTEVGHTGIYTGRWFWAEPAYMGNTDRWADRKLWTSDYDGVPDTTVGFEPYGGWTECRIKQHIGTSEWGGISGIDQNVLSEEEAAELTGEPMPPSNPCEGLISALAYLGDNIADALDAETRRPQGIRKTVIRQQVAEMRRVREQFLGPR